LLWYHDHAFGITRTNAYAGLATGYVITDPAAEGGFEASIPAFRRPVRPPISSSRTRSSSARPGRPPGTAPTPGLETSSMPTPMIRPCSGRPACPRSAAWRCLSPRRRAFPSSSATPSSSTARRTPSLTVEAKPVRFRLLNACNSRFLNPRLLGDGRPEVPDNAEPDVNNPAPVFYSSAAKAAIFPKPFPSAARASRPFSWLRRTGRYRHRFLQGQAGQEIHPL